MATLKSQTPKADFVMLLDPANSALKLTVRHRFFRRPSRLLRLEFARRRATCTGIIGCAASGAPLDAGRRPAARNLTSRRWADLPTPNVAPLLRATRHRYHAPVQISEVTRRDIFDALRVGNTSWSG